ncbi:MAG: hypothetical protein H7235_08820, partial [Bdellovibrionaceae bacterium]|nr:hypothetical protein [Pseudobdellovibrionaceae bacterium]
MNFLIQVFFAVIYLIQVPCLADTISRDLLFSETAYVGGIPCNEPTAGGYCESPVSIYSPEGITLNKKEKIVGACIQGGGDCNMVYLITETKSLPEDFILAQVSTPTNQKVWIKSKKSHFKTMENLMPELGYGSNDVEF